MSHDARGAALARGAWRPALAAAGLPARLRRLPLGILVDSLPFAGAGVPAVTIGRLTWRTLRVMHTPARHAGRPVARDGGAGRASARRELTVGSRPAYVCPRIQEPREGLFSLARSGEPTCSTPKTTCVVVVGAQWGDEGKGKLVDVLAERADFVVRYQGGANAGHTVVIGDSPVHPAPDPVRASCTRGVTCVVGNGVVLEPETFFARARPARPSAASTPTGRIFVSDRAHLVLPYHKLLDAASEQSQKLGTTGRGIGPGVRGQVRPPRHPGRRPAPPRVRPRRCWPTGWTAPTGCSS